MFFIDEVYMFDIECFLYINCVFEFDFVFIVIMVSNRGYFKIRGIDYKFFYGFFFDFFDCVLIINMYVYNGDEIR